MDDGSSVEFLGVIYFDIYILIFSISGVSDLPARFGVEWGSVKYQKDISGIGKGFTFFNPGYCLIVVRIFGCLIDC